jgi:predicted transcriptional regulator
MSDESFIELTASIVAAYVTNNSVQAVNLPSLIESVHMAVAGLDKSIQPQAPPKAPAVNPKKSVFSDYIISLEDGRRFKSMKRHLGLLGLTPQEYRAKWGLPADYPMVAPNYAAARSALAKKNGLGRKVAPANAKAKRAKKA